MVVGAKFTIGLFKTIGDHMGAIEFDPKIERVDYEFPDGGKISCYFYLIRSGYDSMDIPGEAKLVRHWYDTLACDTTFVDSWTDDTVLFELEDCVRPKRRNNNAAWVVYVKAQPKCVNPQDLVKRARVAFEQMGFDTSSKPGLTTMFKIVKHIA